MKRTYEIPEIQEQEYREEFVLKSQIKTDNRKRDNVFALIVAVIFIGLLALSILISSNKGESFSEYKSTPADNLNVGKIL